MSDKRFFYVTHKQPSGFKKIHIVGHAQTHTLCGEPTNLSQDGYETVRLGRKGIPNCPYCMNDLMYYTRFLKHLDVEY